MHRYIVLPFMILCIVLLTGCPPGGVGEGMGEGAGEGTGEGSGEGMGEGSGEGNGEGQVFMVELTLRSREEGSRLKQVWAAVDDQPYTRETFPFSKQANVMRFTATEQELVRTFPANAGTWVTLVAFDSQDSFFSGVSQFTETENIDFPDTNEFDGFDGDLNLSEFGEFGEVAFQMSGSRAIVANYLRMPTIVIRAMVNGEPRVGPGILANAFISEYLTFPDMGGQHSEDFGFSQGFDGFQIIGAMHTGSILTLTPNPDQSDPDLVFINWSGDCEGGMCMATAAENLEITSNWARPE